MSVISSQNLSDFINNQISKSSTSLLFSSGSVYEGSIKDNQACGYGKFSWHNDETFEGFFADGVRVKIGIQKWKDGDEYMGEFYKDKRHGWGQYNWWNGDVYEGSFFEDTRHGFGVYRSKDNGIYEGTFYMNKREGFGTVSYTSGDVFQGLYKEDYRCGPGILVYRNGAHDIGLWHRGSLLKLIINKEDVFRIAQFPDLMVMYPYTSSELITDGSGLSDKESRYTLDDVLRYKIMKPKAIALFNEREIEKTNEKEFVELEDEKDAKNEIIDETEDKDNVPTDPVESEVSVDEIDREEIVDAHKCDFRQEFIAVDLSFQEVLGNLTTTQTTTPIMLKILDHIKRFSKHIPIKHGTESGVDLNEVVRDVVGNVFRSSLSKVPIERQKKYSSPGDIEQKSSQIIASSHIGDLSEIRKIFLDSIVPNVNVTDCRGSFSLLEATLTWNAELVNYLLDCGADINQITDEGISALGSSFLFYYPQQCFIDTIAERVVTLSYTPMNFNGIRREPVQNPCAQVDLIDHPHGHENVIKADSIDLLQDNIAEQWNDYQWSLLGVPENLHHTKITANEIKWQDNKSLDFESHRNNVDYPTKVGPKLLEKAASVLSNNSLMIRRQPRPNSRHQTLSNDEGTARFKALQISRQNQMLQVILLLLRRGADPNVCKVPFPAIFFAVKSGDVEMTKALITKGADVNARLGLENCSLTPLHVATCLPGKKGVIITEILLNNGADPNGRAAEDESFLDNTLIDEWRKDAISILQRTLLGGKTALHLACSRYDNFKVSHQIVQLLLRFGGNPNLICNGHTSLTLAIASGNDLIVDELLASTELNVNLPLTNGLGNALCVASSTTFEHMRSIDARVTLLKKLILNGADVLNQNPIGFKRTLGSSVDYAYYTFFLDQRVSRLPYHALTSVERDLFNNRKNILSYMGMFTRECAVEKEKSRLEAMKIEGIESRGPSPGFVWIGSGVDPEDQKTVSRALTKISHNLSDLDFQMQGSDLLARKPLFKYCYECGRSVNVKLTACTRCKEVFFCSKLCKTKAWNIRHKFECLRVGGRASLTGSEHKINRNGDSPTPATILDDDGLAKERMVLSKGELGTQRNKLEKNATDSGLTSNNRPRKLPPLDSKDHPSYSYNYIMGDYVKLDPYGRKITLNNTFADNYSYE